MAESKQHEPIARWRLQELANAVVSDSPGGLWSIEPLHTLRLAATSFSNHRGMLWASALTYTTCLAIVPVLALALSVLTVLGGGDAIRPLIRRFLAVNSPEIAEQILHFVSNINAATVGSVGGATLLVTVIMTLNTVEQAFNFIFRVARGRTWLRKFSDYLSVTFTMPLLLAAAATINARLTHSIPSVPGVAWLGSVVMVWAGFLFLYMFFPNTHVQWRAAMLGSLVASVLLQIGQRAYIDFQYGVREYQSIYGALASLPILLVWIYMGWVIVLFGGEITAAAQRHESFFAVEARSPEFVRVTALLIAVRVGERMLGQRETVTRQGIANELGAGEHAVGAIVDSLKHGGLIVEGRAEGKDDAGGGLLLARDLASTTVDQVLTCAEAHTVRTRVGEPRIAGLLERIDRGRADALGGLTLAALLTSEDAARHDRPILQRVASGQLTERS
jgi:membrane protein